MEIVKLIQTESGWKASVGEGASDEIVKEGSSNYEALSELLEAMNSVLSARADVPGGWVGGRPNDR